MADTSHNRRRADLITRGTEIMEKIKALKIDGNKVRSSDAEKMARMFARDRELFIYMDEKPGNFDSNYDEWFWKLRQARNNHPIFFQVLSGEVK